MVVTIMTGFLILVVLIGIPLGSFFAFWLAFMMIREVITGDPEMVGKWVF